VDPAAPGEARDRLGVLAPALREIARRYGTPAYVTDIASVEAASEAVSSAFPAPWERRYSLKANDLPALVARLAGLGFGANVVSRGEWALATRAGVPNADITLEGIGKTDADLRAAARAAAAGAPLHWVALESADEAAALARAVRAIDARMAATGRAAAAAHVAATGRIAAAGHVAANSGPWAGDAGLRVDVLLRLNPEVDPETHRGLATGAAVSKFGLTADEVAAAIEAGGGLDGPLRFRGLHLHVGSQLGAAGAWRDAVRRGLALLALLRGGLPTFDTLDVGGGFPVAPLGVPVPDPGRFAREIPVLLAAIPVDRRPDRLAVEPGRVLVARAGWIVARVLHVRERIGPPGEPARLDRSGPLSLAVVPREARTDDRAERLVVIDAGMTELVRPALYGAEHAIVALTSRGRVVAPAPEAVHSRRSAAWGAAAADRDAIRAAREAAAGHSQRLDEARAATGWPLIRVDGPICESTDTFGEHRLPPLQRGDLVAIRDTGAYGAAMRSAYNGRPRPPEVFVEVDGSLTLARRRGGLASLG
jgi:diaminopimelate decarboxylase